LGSSGKEDSSFSEEKEAKRLFIHLHREWRFRLGARG
jgi:hypothetical protein